MKLLSVEDIILSSDIKDKKALFSFLADHMVCRNHIGKEEKEIFEKGLWERENLSVTGIGYEIAIPHIQNDIIHEPTLVFMKSETKIAYESLIGDSVRLIFLIAVPEHAAEYHLQCLAKLSRSLMNEDFRLSLLDENSVDKLYRLLVETCDL